MHLLLLLLAFLAIAINLILASAITSPSVLASRSDPDAGLVSTLPSPYPLTH